jgi:hypothetical protein
VALRLWLSPDLPLSEIYSAPFRETVKSGKYERMPAFTNNGRTKSLELLKTSGS